MTRFRYAPRAEADLDDITDYFASHNPDAGIRLLDEIAARCRLTASHPRTGRPRDDLGVGVRSFVVRQYVIFFRASTDGIEILRILHGAREITADLFE